MIEVTDTNGKVYRFSSTHEAARKLGAYPSLVRAAIKRGHACYGFFSGWRFRRLAPSSHVRLIIIATDADGVRHRLDGYKGAAVFLECSTTTIGRKLGGKDVPCLRGWDLQREVA